MKLTYKEFATLLGYEKKHTLLHYTCKFYGDDGKWAMNVRAEIRWPIYILIFPFVSLIQAVCLLWDGGLREFSPEPRCIKREQISHESRRYKKFQEMRGLSR